jgi:hypothetical protein
VNSKALEGNHSMSTPHLATPAELRDLIAEQLAPFDEVKTAVEAGQALIGDLAHVLGGGLAVARRALGIDNPIAPSAFGPMVGQLLACTCPSCTNLRLIAPEDRAALIRTLEAQLLALPAATDGGVR